MFYFNKGLNSASHNTLQKYKLQDVPPLSLVFWSSIIGGALTTLVSLCLETWTFPSNPKHLALFILHCVIGIGSAFGPLSQNLTSVVMTSLGLATYTVFLFICQYTVMGKVIPGHGNALEICGAILTSLGAIVIPLYSFIKMYYFNQTGTRKF